MRVKLHYQFKEVSGEKLVGKYVETDYNDPIFLNMQFCVEREQYNKLMELCEKNKIIDIHQAVNIMLNEIEPERIIDLISE